MKADLHIHTTFSLSGITRPETVLEIAAERGIDVIAVTDVNTGSWRAFSDASKRYPVQVVFGQEINLPNGRYNDGELLALFLEKPIKSRKTSNVIRETAEQGGITSIARPFCGRRGEFRTWDQIEDWSRVAVEARNGRTFKKRDNEMALEFAQRLQLPATAGSDAHTPFEIGNVYLEFDGTSTSDLKKAILNRDVNIGGEPSSALFTMLSNIGRFGVSL